MFCSFHEKRLAQDKCSSCGASICSDCHRVLNGKVYCPNCLSQTEEFEHKPCFQRSPVTAGLLGIFPGLGQVYNGQLLKGLIIFFTSWLVVPWIYGMYDAYATACRINSRELETQMSSGLLTGCLVLIILFFGLFAGGPFFLVKGIPYMFQTLTGGAPEARVRRVLGDISGAVQSYKTDNGVYPDDVTDLYFGDFSYLTEMHCDTVKNGYRYECAFHPQGYEIKATPLDGEMPSYRMTPGPVVEKF